MKSKSNRLTLRRTAALVLVLALLFSGWVSDAIGGDGDPSGSAAGDLTRQLTEAWGEPYELRDLGQTAEGLQVYETMTFAYESAHPRLIPNLYAGGSVLLAAAAVLFPQVTVLWALSCLTGLGGAAAFPLLWDLEPYMAVYRATVTVSRYTAEGGAEPALAAQETTTYLCYENLGPNNTDRAWVDLDSAETAWDASEAAFAALEPA